MNVLKYPLRNISPQILLNLQEHYPNASVNIKLSHKTTKDSLTEAGFWALIAQLDWSKSGDDDAVIAPVVQALANAHFRHIVDFADILSHKLYLLDSEIYLSQDDETAMDADFVADRFLYTRCCVIANGLTFFNHIRRHPTEIPHALNFAALLRIPNEAFKKQTGKPLDHVWAYPIETFSNTLGWSELKLTDKLA
jgi:Protein of unknown function (DUF4240)